MSVIITDAPADYHGAIWMPAHASNFHKGRPAPWNLIVVHCTDGHGAARPVADMWREPHHGSSAHFVIGQLGEIVQAVRLTDTAFHAHGANGRSIGIEHCCRTPGELGPKDTGLLPSAVQLESAAKLVAYLCRLAGLVPSRDVIRGHAEVDSVTTHTGCPTSAGIDLDAYVARVVACGDWGV